MIKEQLYLPRDLMVAIVGTLVFILNVHQFYLNCLFSGDVVHVIGTVTERSVTRSSGGSLLHGGGHLTTTYQYHLSYRFEDSNGKTQFWSGDVDSVIYDGLRDQGPVP